MYGISFMMPCVYKFIKMRIGIYTQDTLLRESVSSGETNFKNYKKSPRRKVAGREEEGKGGKKMKTSCRNVDAIKRYCGVSLARAATQCV